MNTPTTTSAPSPRMPGEAPKTVSQPSLLSVLAAGIGVSLIGCAIIASLEVVFSIAFARRRLFGESVPTRIWWDALGKVGITHLIVWTPILLAVAATYWALFRRRSTKPLALLIAVFVLICGLIIVPLDLSLADRDKPVFVYGSMLGSAALATALYFFIRLASRGVRLARWGRVAFRLMSALSLLILTVTNFADASLLTGKGGRARATAMTTQPTDDRPNVLLIVLDTTRADHTSLNGYAKSTTPFLEELAKSSLVCDWTISNGMWTVPTHASMFTGLSLREHGAGHRHLWLDDRYLTLAEALRDAGYATGFFSNNPLIAPSTNMTQGFQTRRVIHDLRRIGRFSLEQFLDQTGVIPPFSWLDGDFGASVTNDLIADWLAERDSKPVFLFVNYMEAHLPYRVPRSYRRMFMTDEQVARSYELRYSVHGNILEKLDLDYNLVPQGFMSKSDEEVMRAQYDATIRYLDDRVRDLLGIFDRAGRLRNTLVIVTADHGENLGDHGMWGHRFMAYQSLTHVPLLIHDPRRPSAARLATPAQLSDIYATVTRAALGDAAPNPPAESCDLFEWLQAPVERTAITQYRGPADQTLSRFIGVKDPTILHRSSPQIAAVGPRYKYLESMDGARELFDLQNDPGELVNLYEREPELARTLQDYIAAWRERTPEYKLPANRAADVAPEALKALMSLGYITGDDKKGD